MAGPLGPGTGLVAHSLELTWACACPGWHPRGLVGPLAGPVGLAVCLPASRQRRARTCACFSVFFPSGCVSPDPTARRQPTAPASAHSVRLLPLSGDQTLFVFRFFSCRFATAFYGGHLEKMRHTPRSRIASHRLYQVCQVCWSPLEQRGVRQVVCLGGAAVQELGRVTCFCTKTSAA